MPFVSKAQRAYLEIHHPEIAKEFAAHTSASAEKHLPEHKDDGEAFYAFMSKNYPGVLQNMPKETTHDSARALRLDRGRLAKVRRTSQGFARVDARLTRTGILEYARADGTIQREYRPESEVFKADSLATLDGVPVTDLHPTVMVDAQNVGTLSRGHVRAPKRDGRFVGAELQVEHSDLISKIDAGERHEISCGYTCELDMTPGEYEGRRYDAVQRNIEYNHVAIGPRDWGRAGSDVALRLDGGAPLISKFDESSDVAETKDCRGIIPPGKKTMKIGKFEVKLDANDEQIVSEALKASDERASAAEAKVAQLEAAAGQAAVELKAATDRADAACARIAKLDRAELEQSARSALGEAFKFDGKSDAEIRAAVIAKVLPDVRLDGAADAFVQGAYTAALKIAAKASAELVEAGKQSGSHESRNDSNDPEVARREMIERNRKRAAG